MRIAVVDDNPKDGGRLKQYIERYASEQKMQFEVFLYTNGLDFLDDMGKNFDIVFMDIEMPHLDGIQTAKKMRETDDIKILVFITNLAQYAIQHLTFNLVQMSYHLPFVGRILSGNLLWNILDNAIESVTKEADKEKRVINLHVLRREQILHIHADNYCNEDIVFEDGMPVTNKKDKAYHGFGVRSIRHVAEKYGGEMVLKKENERFVLDLLIPIPEEVMP